MKTNCFLLSLAAAAALPGMAFAQSFLVDPSNPSNHALDVISGGNIGIGIAAPATRLQIAGGDLLIDNSTWYSGLNGQGLAQPLIRSRTMGFTGGNYFGLQIGRTGDHIAFFIDPAPIAGGGFDGFTENELVTPNKFKILQANSAGTDWMNSMTLSDGNVTFPGGNVGIGTESPGGCDRITM